MTEALVAQVMEALNRLGVPYMVTGSLASNSYGIARFTQDADFVVEFGETPVSAFLELLGSDFVLDPQISFETISFSSRYRLLSTQSDFTIELFLLSDQPYDKLRFGRRQRVVVLGIPTYLPTPEDVIVTKLMWSRHGKRYKDVDDARGVIAVQGDRLDWPYIRKWCTEHGTLPLLEQMRSEICDGP